MECWVSRENQEILISELKENNYIIVGGPSFNWDMPINKKLPLYDEYIPKLCFIFWITII